MTASTKTGWREAEALANEGCAATLEAAVAALVDAVEMLQHHHRDAAVKDLLAAQGRLKDEWNGFLERANQARGDT